MLREEAPDGTLTRRDVVARSGGLGASACLHLFLAVVLIGPSSGSGFAPAAPVANKSTAEIVFAPPEDDEFPGLNPFEEPADVPAFAREYADVTIRNATFDVSRIAERAHVLFPFISPGLSLELFALTPQDAFQTYLNSPLIWSEATAPAERAKTLSLTPDELQRLVDRSWARRDRWNAVQPVLELVRRHDATSGDAARLVREYAEQNLGQYYEDPRGGGRDARIWTELALAADHADFIRFVRDFVSAHPGTETTIELLFLLDKVVESNRNVLASLQAVEPKLHLEETRLRDKDAYALVLRLKDHYSDLLERRGLPSETAVSTMYAKVRVAILNGILRTTPRGYRANDARVLIGWIQWRSSNVEDALAAWCGIEPGGLGEYADLADALVNILRVPVGTDSCTTRTASIPQMVAIEKAVQRERGRLWEFQYRRLSGFGYSLDSF